MSTWSSRAAKGSKIAASHSALSNGYHHCQECQKFRQCRCDDDAARARSEGRKEGREAERKRHGDVAALDRQMKANLPTRSQLRRGR